MIELGFYRHTRINGLGLRVDRRDSTTRDGIGWVTGARLIRSPLGWRVFATGPLRIEPEAYERMEAPR